jgi:hypothetical protein
MEEILEAIMMKRDGVAIGFNILSPRVTITVGVASGKIIHHDSVMSGLVSV